MFGNDNMNLYNIEASVKKITSVMSSLQYFYYRSTGKPFGSASESGASYCSWSAYLPSSTGHLLVDSSSHLLKGTASGIFVIFLLDFTFSHLFQEACQVEVQRIQKG